MSNKRQRIEEPEVHEVSRIVETETETQTPPPPPSDVEDTKLCAHCTTETDEFCLGECGTFLCEDCYVVCVWCGNPLCHECANECTEQGGPMCPGCHTEYVSNKAEYD